MARSDKDIFIKQNALRFCIATNTVPYLEVFVSSVLDLSQVEKIMTDIDVLGLHLSPSGDVNRALFDCKTSKSSPISRAFWLSGLMQFVHAAEGYVILGRKAERAHRVSAESINIRLFDEQGFLSYAVATNSTYKIFSSYAADIENWHLLEEGVAAAGTRFLGLYRHLFSEVPLTREPPRAIRRLLSIVKEHRGELDPSKELHQALFCEIVLATTLLMVPMIGELRNLVELSDTKDDFSNILRYYIWGGRDGVAMLQRINDMRGEHSDLGEFENNMLAWPSLLQLVRGVLEAPTALASCCLPIREMTLRTLASKNEESDRRIGLAMSAPRIRQFSNRVASYIVAATKLPDDFLRRFSADIDGLMETAKGAVRQTG